MVVHPLTRPSEHRVPVFFLLFPCFDVQVPHDGFPGKGHDVHSDDNDDGQQGQVDVEQVETLHADFQELSVHDSVSVVLDVSEVPVQKMRVFVTSGRVLQHVHRTEQTAGRGL